MVVREAKRMGLKVLLWFLGDCMPLLEDIVELGVDALVVEQPRRGYSSDVGEIRRRVGQRLCVFGWTPELAMIKSDRQAIRRAVETQIRAAGLEGAFVMGTTYLTNEVRCETVDFLCDEVLRVSRS
jgi:uroporphyrinogen-III decarboxylase